MSVPNITLLQSGKYRIVRVLGQGGFGITYLAEHTLLDKRVAIKEFFPKEYCDRDESTSHLIIGTKSSVEIVEMLKGKFIKEARNISRLNHPNIITIHDIFQENDTAYYVMEYIDGESLAEIVKCRGALPESEAVGYIRKVADAVGYMHSLRMNHLDLKPANIMVRKSDGEPILIDFGLSKQYDASGGQTSTTPIGISHGFAAPEQYCPGGVSAFTPQTDIYALGATFFNLLTGTIPPAYNDILENGLFQTGCVLLSNCVDVIKHAMSIKKLERPSTADEFVKELTCTIANNSAIAMTKSANIANKQITEDTVMLNVDKFVDLGLSVKWATTNIGANDKLQTGHSFVKSDKSIMSKRYAFEAVPAIKHFQELIAKCEWSLSQSGGRLVYNITGPNGNSIVLPLNHEKRFLGEQMPPFEMYWTEEALFDSEKEENKIFYLDDSCHIITMRTTCDIECPIRLIST